MRFTRGTRRLNCAEIWGGIKNADLDVCASGMTVGLYSVSCDGGKGGDAYYFSVCDGNSVTRLVLADVVGHGEQVSEISQWVYDEMAARLDDPDLAGMVSELNSRVVSRGFGAMTTVAVLSYHVDLDRLFYCYAGHPPMLACRENGEWNELLLPCEGIANLPLGVSKEVRYDMNEVSLAKGDRLLLFSDGVLEARDTNGEEFGAARLRDTITQAGDADPMKLKSLVIRKLHEWTGGPLDHDDVTVITIQID